MKTCLFKPGSRAGFTLVEAFGATFIFCSILIAAMVGVQVFGLRLYTLGGTKLSASNGAMKVLNNVRQDIRAAKTLYVGKLTTVNNPATFVLDATNVSTTTYITGSALKILPTTNAYPYYVYYLDYSGATNYFVKATTADGVNFSNSVLAGYVTNLVVFREEDPFGAGLTNYYNNRVVRMELDFYQWEYPIGFVGGTGANAYNFYRLTTRISRRLVD